LWLVFSGLGFVSMSGLELIEKGSLYSPYIKLDGQYWRLFTYMFLHGGIMHILNNLLSLFFVGIILEPIIGRWKCLTLYLLCGIGAGITSLLWHDEVNTVGASGAIFGLYGFMIILILMKVTDKSINKAFLVIGSISLIISLITGMFGTIDNAAHIGGLLTGGLLGLLYTPILKQQQEE
jgi:membrane associated rhomboid family serine protease